MERGRHLPLTALEPATRAAFDQLLAAVDAAPQNWRTFSRQTIEFHVRSAQAWGNAQMGFDLTTQIDPDFVLHPHTA